jgi:putative phosphoesterase
VIIGVISDTHGLLRPQALACLQGCDYILHAGDIGSPDIVPALQEIAPVYAIRGNVDIEPWARKIPTTLEVSLNGFRFFLIHNRAELKSKMLSPETDAVIHGHSHQPRIETRAGVLFFNPGSAGPRRFKLPISIGRIVVSRTTLSPELIQIR